MVRVNNGGGVLVADGTYFRFLQNVHDNCGLNLCLLDFVGCCDCGVSAGRPFSEVEVAVGACMVEEDDATVATVRENLGAMEDRSNPR